MNEDRSVLEQSDGGVLEPIVTCEVDATAVAKATNPSQDERTCGKIWSFSQRSAERNEHSLKIQLFHHTKQRAIITSIARTPLPYDSTRIS